MAAILIINSAEKRITQYVEPLQNILEQSGVASEMIECEDSLNTDMSLYDEIIMSGSPQRDDIVDLHLSYFQRY
ncbi:MAG: hypothetical protein JSV88_20795 [Candidatus Aminicenantes bacterium]|nr:MAG: hypothetical protein JSV88_20795 [Candidatus Aminicenantes bacterium]